MYEAPTTAQGSTAWDSRLGNAPRLGMSLRFVVYHLDLTSSSSRFSGGTAAVNEHKRSLGPLGPGTRNRYTKQYCQSKRQQSDTLQNRLGLARTGRTSFDRCFAKLSSIVWHDASQTLDN